jgi:predicted nucleic acid-binding protein
VTAAILDNSALVLFHQLGLIDHLAFLFDDVLIPREVKHEFLGISDPDEQLVRERFFLETLPANLWLRECDQYDEFNVKFWTTKPGIDMGEAGVLAQNQELGGLHVLIIDERRARALAQVRNFHVQGSLRLLAKLHWQSLVDYHQCISRINNDLGFRCTSALAERALEAARLELGIALPDAPPGDS